MLPMLPRCGAIEVAMKELEEQDLKKKHQVTPGPYISYMGYGGHPAVTNIDKLVKEKERAADNTKKQNPRPKH